MHVYPCAPVDNFNSCEHADASRAIDFMVFCCCCCNTKKGEKGHSSVFMQSLSSEKIQKEKAPKVKISSMFMYINANLNKITHMGFRDLRKL